MSTKKNKGGFALAIMLPLLPVFVSSLVLVASLIGFTQNDLAIKAICRVGGSTGQSKVIRPLKTLLSLNPLAKTLRAKKALAIKDFAIAMSSQNPIALAAATSQLEKVKKKQELLDSKQKQIIRQSNLILSLNHSQTFHEIQAAGKSATNLLLSAEFSSAWQQPPKLSVQPSDPDLAPIFELSPRFEQDQALAHFWQYSLTVKPPFSDFLPGVFSFQKSCSVTLAREGSTWKPKIKMDKSLLKSVW